jgi:hypothetical protein
MKKQIEYTLPEVAKKLETNIELNEIERQMAAGAIRNWLKLVGRPKKYQSEEERLAARRESYTKANAKRRTN